MAGRNAKPKSHLTHRSIAVLKPVQINISKLNTKQILKWSEKASNEILERVVEKRKLLNHILRCKPNWIGHILRRIYLLYDVIEGQMSEVERVGRTQLLDDLKNR